jgi:ATP-dependent protease ClpP protease subunit
VKPRNAAELRAFLNRRAEPVRPRNAVPPVTVDGNTATLRLYDPIDDWGEGWGMSASEFAEALDDLPANVGTIRLLINSPGGEIFDGWTIVNTMRAHPARVVALVQGLAASMASVIAVAADELVMMPNSELMIHDVTIAAWGNAADFRQTADELDHFSDNIASLYATKAGGSARTWRDKMRAETWYTAGEAVAARLADRVADVTPTGENARRLAADARRDRDELALLAL